MPTLLQAIERVVELAKDSKMSDEFMLEAAPEIGLLADRYGITERQAVLFCICMEKGPRRVDYDALASKYDFSGGQIENIARHYTIDNILHGQSEDVLPMLIRHCDNERVDEKKTRKIGF